MKTWLDKVTEIISCLNSQFQDAEYDECLTSELINKCISSKDWRLYTRMSRVNNGFLLYYSEMKDREDEECIAKFRCVLKPDETIDSFVLDAFFWDGEIDKSEGERWLNIHGLNNTDGLVEMCASHFNAEELSSLITGLTKEYQSRYGSIK